MTPCDCYASLEHTKQTDIRLSLCLNKSVLFIAKFCAGRFIDTAFHVQLMNLATSFIDYFLEFILDGAKKATIRRI